MYFTRNLKKENEICTENFEMLYYFQKNRLRVKNNRETRDGAGNRI